MVISTFATPATAALAMATARTLIDEFACSFVRVWLDDGFGSAEPIATLGGAPDGNHTLAPDAAARAIALGRRSLEPVTIDDGYRISLPLRGAGSAFGCVECYRPADVSFADAERIEGSLVRFAMAIESAAATDALERESRGTVLVIDEDPMLLSLLSTALRKSGFSTLEASDGPSAMRAMERRSPDVVLMDFSLGSGSRETSDLVRGRPAATPIPIVMLVDSNDAAARVAAMEAGADECVGKPFDIRDLITRVANVLRWRKLLARTGTDDGGHNRESKQRLLGDALALYKSRHGNLGDALELFVIEAESSEAAQRFDNAARAYRGAAAAAREMRKEDLANKFTRIAGKMYLTFAETTTNARHIENAYVAAAKCFLEAGNMELTSKSLVLVDDFETVTEAREAL